MRKILLMLCLLLGYCVTIVADNTYTIDATTLNSPASEGSASFSKGLTITNGGGQNYKSVRIDQLPEVQ